MDLDDIKRGLRAEIKRRENEQYATFQCNVRQMCKDVLAKLEEQEAEIAELKDRYKDMDIAHTVHIAKMNDKIEEQETEIAELKAKLENVQATAYTDSVDAGMRERRLKRALWLARAWRAESVMEYLTMKCRYFEKSFGKDVPKCDVDLLAKWAKIIPKCRAKEEEYK